MKISYKDYAKIQNYNKDHRCMRLVYKFNLTKMEEGIYDICKQTKLSSYLFLLIPEIIVQFFYVIWDGGLKDFQFPTIEKTHRYVYHRDKAYDYVDKLYNSSQK